MEYNRHELSMRMISKNEEKNIEENDWEFLDRILHANAARIEWQNNLEICAFFQSEEEANKCEAELRVLGFKSEIQECPPCLCQKCKPDLCENNTYLNNNDNNDNNFSILEDDIDIDNNNDSKTAYLV
jgi:hypothetical protein